MNQSLPVFEHFPEHDIVYLKFASKQAARSEPAGSFAIVDYGEDGSLVGIELLEVSRGVDVAGLPEAERIRATLGLPSGIDPGAPGRIGMTPAGHRRERLSHRQHRIAALRR